MKDKFPTNEGSSSKAVQKDKTLENHQLLVFEVKSLRVPNQEKDID